MKQSIIKVVVFAVAFAFVEAAVVIYLRRLFALNQASVSQDQILFLIPGIAFLEPRFAVKIITDTAILNIERLREAATLIMLASVAALAAKNLKQKIAFFLLMFGVWDIFYYIFLKLTIGWPKSLLDLDTFFLLPTPWVGPVIAPISISLLIIAASILYLVKGNKR
ncbi:hypothetical protein HYW40_00060 [Candidatus Curtissbacteria bacterium]|nr:hypothetical protein [Candidatus Curtissbacteria bacterium]